MTIRMNFETEVEVDAIFENKTIQSLVDFPMDSYDSSTRAKIQWAVDIILDNKGIEGFSISMITTSLMIPIEIRGEEEHQTVSLVREMLVGKLKVDIYVKFRTTKNLTLFDLVPERLDIDEDGNCTLVF